MGSRLIAPNPLVDLNPDEPTFSGTSECEIFIIQKLFVGYFTVKGYTRKGGVLYALKRFTDAQKTYQKAIELDPNNKVTNACQNNDVFVFVLLLPNLARVDLLVCYATIYVLSESRSPLIDLVWFKNALTINALLHS